MHTRLAGFRSGPAKRTAKHAGTKPMLEVRELAHLSLGYTGESAAEARNPAVGRGGPIVPP